MNVYIWEELGNVTDNYHTEAGAVVVAESVEDAVALLKTVAKAEWLKSDCALYTTPPNVTIPCDPTVPRMARVFPNAGCC